MSLSGSECYSVPLVVEGGGGEGRGWVVGREGSGEDGREGGELCVEGTSHWVLVHVI